MMLTIGFALLLVTEICRASQTNPANQLNKEEPNNSDFLLDTRVKENSHKDISLLKSFEVPYKDTSDVPKCPIGREGSLEPCDPESSTVDGPEQSNVDILKSNEKKKDTIPRKEASLFENADMKGIQSGFLKNSFVNMKKKGSVPRKGVLSDDEVSKFSVPRKGVQLEEQDPKLSVPRKGVQLEEHISKLSVPRKGVLPEEQISKLSIPRKGVLSEEQSSKPLVPRKGVLLEEQVSKPSVPRKGVLPEDYVLKPSVPRKEVLLQEEASKPSVPRKGVPVLPQEQLLQPSFSKVEGSKSSVPRKGVPTLEQVMESSVPRKDVPLSPEKHIPMSNVSSTTQPSLTNGAVSSGKYTRKKVKHPATIDVIDGQPNASGGNAAPILVSLGFLFICAGIVALLFSRKFKEYWYRRQYSRVDFLTDGMYNT